MRDMKKPIVIMVAALALALAGCASSEDESFKQDFNAAQEPLNKLLTDSAGASDPASMGKIADGLDDTAKKMAALDAPDDAKDELDTFVKEVNASADTMREAQKAMEDQDLEKMTTILTELQKHMTAVGEAQQKLATVVNG
jgi:flagellar hook-basal body complex protein FliE